MAEVNKKANLIINEVARSGETVVIIKHGKPIAEIRPITDPSHRQEALRYLRNLTPISVDDSVESVIEQARQRGL
ncbi:MAG: type II toxin-antitoxin system Phd/YefM family antitoxin [Pseudomonadales bacterium]